MLYTPGCREALLTLRRLRRVLRETGVPADVELVRVDDPDQAKRLNFPGSPTVRINGVDIEPYVTFLPPQPGLACRRYREEGEERPAPSERVLRDAVEMADLVERGVLHRCS